MNFQELMSKASANSASASRQNLTRSGHKHKDSGPGVSNSAVKAFLQRKEQEQKKKQANEESARRARIQARLQQDLKANQGKKSKGESTPKSSSLNPTYAHEEEREEKSIPVKQKRDAVVWAAQHQDSGRSSQPSISGIKNKDIDRNTTTSNMKIKNSQRISKEKSGKINGLMEIEKKNDTSKTNKKKKKAPPPPNFKELLAIAEQNKFGLKKTRNETVTSKSKVEVEESKVKRQDKGGGEVDLTEIDEKNMRIKNHVKVKDKAAVAKVKEKQTVSRPKTTAVEPGRSVNERSKSLKRTRDSDTLGKNAIDKKPSKPLPHYARPQEAQHRMNYYPRQSHDNYYDDEEDSDLDGFIVDGEDEMAEEQTDVSKYIKDIFGYDRRRYVMEDFDDSTMESNYSQIEREEKRSAKIAKLEDEIEILKEQAELKRMRDKLKKSRK